MLSMRAQHLDKPAEALARPVCVESATALAGEAAPKFHKSGMSVRTSAVAVQMPKLICQDGQQQQGQEDTGAAPCIIYKAYVIQSIGRASKSL